MQAAHGSTASGAGWRERFAQHLIPAAFIFSATGLIALGWVGYHLLTRTYATDALVLRTAVTIGHLERLHQTIVEAESTGRAFLISGESRYRLLAQKKLNELDYKLREVEVEIENDPAQHAQLIQLDQHIARRFAYLESLMQLRATRGFDAMRDASIGTGVAEMQIITTLLNGIKTLQASQLSARTAARQEGDRALETLLAFFLVTALAVLSLMFRHANRLWALRALAEADALHMAHHDALTGLPNRRLLDDRLLIATARAARHRSSFAVLCLDLDGFKAINDQHGHLAGDDLLRQVAERLRRTLRMEDTVARLGGDEFVVVLSSVSDRTYSERVAEKIIHAVSQPFELGTGEARISTSIGIAQYPIDSASPDDLLQYADIALYEAKKTGRMRAVVWKERRAPRDSRPRQIQLEALPTPIYDGVL